MNLPLIKAIIILPGTALVYVPALILWLTRGTTYAARLPPVYRYRADCGGRGPPAEDERRYREKR